MNKGIHKDIHVDPTTPDDKVFTDEKVFKDILKRYKSTPIIFERKNESLKENTDYLDDL